MGQGQWLGERVEGQKDCQRKVQRQEMEGQRGLKGQGDGQRTFLSLMRVGMW